MTSQDTVCKLVDWVVSLEAQELSRLGDNNKVCTCAISPIGAQQMEIVVRNSVDLCDVSENIADESFVVSIDAVLFKEG